MNEFLDILSFQGGDTGEVKERVRVHKDGDWHRTVHVWIVNSRGDLILQKRHPFKHSHPNKWDISCAGHISSGDDPLSTAVRETAEELGLNIQPEALEWLFLVRNSDDIGNGFTDNEWQEVYLLEHDVDPSTLSFQREEVAALKQMHYTELESLVNRADPAYVPHPDEYALLFAELHRRFKDA